ncbi:MAG: trimethylamine methyltransferase family protein, partial [Firmicutes bacterium]|nr:trimethylamine methyltransferase family protein [Bacillota bacterium]
MTAMLPALAGANVIYGLGMLELGITFDFGQLVIDNEIAMMIKHVVNGIEINDYNMAV